MPNVDFTLAHDLVTPGGTILLNQPDTTGSHPTRRLYLIRPDGYKIVPALRVTSDNNSQADGSVLHPRLKTGLVATMTVAYLIANANWPTDPEVENACDDDLLEMHDALVAALDSIREATGSTQRLIWTPPGVDRRMLEGIEVLNWLEPTIEDDGEVRVTFAVESPFPYAISYTQTNPALGATVTNDGTADFMPVIEIQGPFSSFTLSNTTLGLDVVYDAALPGGASVAGGHHLELDFFRGTAFLDGNSSDLIGGIDPTLSDFFPIAKGANVLTLSGATGSILMNDAFA